MRTAYIVAGVGVLAAGGGILWWLHRRREAAALAPVDNPYLSIDRTAASGFTAPDFVAPYPTTLAAIDSQGGGPPPPPPSGPPSCGPGMHPQQDLRSVGGFVQDWGWFCDGDPPAPAPAPRPQKRGGISGFFGGIAGGVVDVGKSAAGVAIGAEKKLAGEQINQFQKGLAYTTKGQLGGGGQ